VESQGDSCLQSDGYSNYSLEALMTAKCACKAALQHELGLPVRGEHCLFTELPWAADNVHKTPMSSWLCSQNSHVQLMMFTGKLFTISVAANIMESFFQVYQISSLVDGNFGRKWAQGHAGRFFTQYVLV
jgi:hypothetical protein